MRTNDQIRDRAGRTALLVATRNLRTATCEKLLSSGKLEVLSSVDVQDDTGRTAVVYACRQVLGQTAWVATWRWLGSCQQQCKSLERRLSRLYALSLTLHRNCMRDVAVKLVMVGAVSFDACPYKAIDFVNEGSCLAACVVTIHKP